MLEPWLPELHSKLWKQEQLRPILFRTVDITRAHYAELEKRLNEAHKTRNLETYMATNVISIKLDVLQNFIPAVADKVNSEVSDDGPDNLCPDELFEFLPAKIRYLDITPLELQHLPRISFPMLIREQYDVMSTILYDQQVLEGISGSCLITGQPGAGKTSYLYVLLIDRLLRGKDTIFQSINGRIYEISNTGVLELPLSTLPTLSGNELLVLVDGDGNQAAPMHEVHAPRARIIVASSNKDKTSRRWMKQIPGVPAMAYMINPFSSKEFLLTGIFLYVMDVTYARLNAARKHLGNDPRCGFCASLSSSYFEEQVESITANITAVAASTDIGSLIYDIRIGGTSSQLFQIYTNDNRQSENCHIEQVSDWSFNRLLDKYEQWRTVNAGRDFFNVFRTQPRITTFVWERQFFRFIQSPRTFVLRSLDDPSECTTCEWEFSGDAEHQTFESGSFPAGLQALIEDKTSGHLKPLSSAGPVSDALAVYQPSRLIFLQFKRGNVESDDSRIVSGFERVQRWLKLECPHSSHLHPSESRPWMIISIVPEESAASFKQQSFGRVWNLQVKQYVLGSPQKDLWEC
ncbi:hypothetical protein M413DRAFT_25378 [Hebeloma cylindrosporum]|uniref:Uncharacterized protein n=1 Tax=Hebeloma cylindrosporum TaxID=76867 RepID=A0A0C2Y552_HEBCY|nr:hypothetical protein M413DRAFT_25378 [Hebeloma cylindrosporum h7]